MRFEYDCPNCDSEMEGDIGDDVTCSNCGKTYETEFEYITEDSLGAWLLDEIDKPHVIRAGNITVASGWKCERCGLVRSWEQAECRCNETNNTSR